MPTNDPNRLTPAVARLAGRMLPASSYSLETAAQLADMDGVGCLLVLRIPEKSGAPIEASFHSGRAKFHVTD